MCILFSEITTKLSLDRFPRMKNTWGYYMQGDLAFYDEDFIAAETT